MEDLTARRRAICLMISAKAVNVDSSGPLCNGEGTPDLRNVAPAVALLGSRVCATPLIKPNGYNAISALEGIGLHIKLRCLCIIGDDPRNQTPHSWLDADIADDVMVRHTSPRLINP